MTPTGTAKGHERAPEGTGGLIIWSSRVRAPPAPLRKPLDTQGVFTLVNHCYAPFAPSQPLSLLHGYCTAESCCGARAYASTNTVQFDLGPGPLLHAYCTPGTDGTDLRSGQVVGGAPYSSGLILAEGDTSN